MSIPIAFVGCSHIHVPGFINMLKKVDGVSVKYAWDPEIERAQKWGGEVGAQVVTDLNVIAKDPDIKAVVITSKTVEHTALVKKFAKAGKHIFVEKPLGMSAEDAKKQAKMINKAGVLFSTGYFMRSFPINMYAREMIQSGKLGKITRISMSNCHQGSLAGWFDTEWRWMTKPKQSGCGAFGDLGTHILDILLWFMEGDKVKRVTGAIDSATGRYGKVDEYGQGLIRFKSGAVANIAAGWVSNADPYKMDISGTDGELYVEAGKLLIKTKDMEKAQEVTDLPDAMPHAFMIFIERIAGISELPVVTADEAALRNKVMEKIYLAARENTWING
ncbi:MAG TPA: gfo/Idh/MocA family oxidoreductase [Phycisphaerales bacterium]|nr:gfo/Idh/MocA family oxidoreductase [Phycisphaerales bacterium]HCD33875.1 gfo/Idh/MocA family oxidoreductase [Phycisphaerales bacterium]|tara:strand:+ start:40106 stop:41101 length:996 start_codon:yes stop_codon:yes gene_type:complete